MDLSVVIVYYKGLEKLARCLDSLQAMEDSQFSFEVIVVDNRSDDGSIEMLRTRYPRFSFLSNTGNNGFANGCNLGASQCHGSTLLFLNPDTTVTADALAAMLREVNARPVPSIVTCSQVREDGTYDRPYGRFLSLPTLTGWLRALNRMVHGRIGDSFPQDDQRLFPDWVSGSVVMIRADGFSMTGGWSEDYWMYYEDVDLCKKVRMMNGEIVLLKGAVVGHAHGGSSRINMPVTVMTKTEVHISRHVYISRQEKGITAFFMHLVLILDNMLLGWLPAVAGLLFFFLRPVRVLPLLYFSLAGYYFGALLKGSWLSSRSVNYRG